MTRNRRGDLPKRPLKSTTPDNFHHRKSAIAPYKDQAHFENNAQFLAKTMIFLVKIHRL
jgi:hypothetical protein